MKKFIRKHGGQLFLQLGPCNVKCVTSNKARIFLFVDLWGEKIRFRVGRCKKSSENDQLTGHFQIFFLISSEQTVKLVK